jgi:hypothetical protein
MEKLFEAPNKMMEEAFDQWKKLLGQNALWPTGGAPVFQENLTKWVSAMSSAYITNVEAWNSLLDQNEELLFKVYKESPFYNAEAENRMRDACNSIAKARKSYQEILKDSFARIEDALKESGEQAES